MTESTKAKAAAKDQARTARKAQEVAKQAEAASPAQQDGVRNGTSLTDHREIEIKLGVLGRPDSLPEVFASLGKVAGERSDLLENTYFDTPDDDLFKAGIGLRIRHGKDFSEQTLKLRGKNQGGLHSRGEFNIPISRSAKLPKLSKFPFEVFPDGFDIDVEQHLLQPLCRISFTRESFDFEIMDSLFGAVPHQRA